MLLITIARIQIKMNPYKIRENNDIEVMSIIAGMLVLYCGIIFEKAHDHDYPLFSVMAMIILVFFNGMFLINWLYYFLVSINFKNEKMGMFIILYATLICKSKQNSESESHKNGPQQSDKIHDKSRTRKRKYSKSNELFMLKSRYVYQI